MQAKTDWTIFFCRYLSNKHAAENKRNIDNTNELWNKLSHLYLHHVEKLEQLNNIEDKALQWQEWEVKKELEEPMIEHFPTQRSQVTSGEGNQLHKKTKKTF